MIKENLKFDVRDNPELSRQIQELLFEVGYEWYGSDDIKHGVSYIYVRRRAKNLTYGRDKIVFQNHEHKLTTLQELRKMLNKLSLQEALELPIGTAVSSDFLTLIVYDDEKLGKHLIREVDGGCVFLSESALNATYKIVEPVKRLMTAPEIFEKWPDAIFDDGGNLHYGSKNIVSNVDLHLLGGNVEEDKYPELQV